ncbi:MAG TPA: nucleoside-diphosphate kinase [Candidatus Bilamarchaeaceae archaeon]|nr:nucleoside-diphosphate kinase [Candidatus Bilamarchaeaceae archaeon]
MERTCVLIKPDGLQRGFVGDVISRFEKKGLKIIGMKMLRMDKKLAQEHYAHLVDKAFYPDLEKFVTGHPVIAFVLEGKDAIEVVRNMCGITNARKAASGTIRGDLSMSTSRNIIHASDSREVAKKEIVRFFQKEELFDYTLNENYLYAADE